jgi:hypothetical protein|tara:strand:+ start:2765 stop:2995 length:231 start_codon:yes stop_codon:yes gene_type:complete
MEKRRGRVLSSSLSFSSNFCATMTRRFFVGVRRRLRRVKRTHKMEKNLSLWWLLLGKSASSGAIDITKKKKETRWY